MLNRYKTIFWDFDGVILDSNHVRTNGFKFIFKSFEKNKVDQLLKYHHSNGGLSRYNKIRYFFEEINGKIINDQKIKSFADKFSKYCFERLKKKSLIIEDSMSFIMQNSNYFDFHIVSASDEKELNEICKKLKITQYFSTINGSPKTKYQNLNDIILKYKYDFKKCCLIGDSFNDKEAAEKSGISFFAYNNKKLSKCSNNIYSFKSNKIIFN